MHNFEFVKPTSVAEAVKALQADGAQALSGGQTLIATMKQRLADPTILVSLTGIAANRYVKVEGGTLTIGGATTHAQVAREATAIPAIAFLAGNIGDPSVRNRGTIGGSLANNDPSACYPAAAIACGATIVTDRREIAADQYFKGMFETALEEGEIIIAVKFPIPTHAHYQKFFQPASRFALVGVFVAKYAAHVGVGVTGASADGVFRWKAAETALQGSFAAAAVDGLTAPDAGHMIADLHGSGAYRAQMVKVLTARALTASAVS